MCVKKLFFFFSLRFFLFSFFFLSLLCYPLFSFLFPLIFHPKFPITLPLPTPLSLRPNFDAQNPSSDGGQIAGITGYAPPGCPPSGCPGSKTSSKRHLLLSENGNLVFRSPRSKRFLPRCSCRERHLKPLKSREG